MDAPEAREFGYHLGWWGLLTPLIYMVDDMVNIWVMIWLIYGQSNAFSTTMWGWYKHMKNGDDLGMVYYPLVN
jgi:hypothetical protein